MAERARRFGPMRFDEVLDTALYAPGAGFYETGGGAGGEGGHFLTSVEVGPLFGAVLAQALDAWWEDLGRPDPYVVVEAGAGRGRLAASILAAAPACGPALRYVLVERSSALRRAQASSVALEDPAQVLGPVGSAEADEAPMPAPGLGPLATALADLPARRFPGVVLANELLDNLPFRLLERGADGWAEVFVDDHLGEVTVPVERETAATADALAPDARAGSRVPLQERAQAWLRAALGGLTAGRVVVFDYGDATANLADRPWHQWVRTYRSHAPGGPPLEHLGAQDVTCEVAVDQLAAVRVPTLDRSQVDFLAAHGLAELVDQARRRWQEGASVGDLGALRARSRMAEAAALTDPAGLGAFRVLEWEVRF